MFSPSVATLKILPSSAYIMCNYIEQPYVYSGCTSEVQHVHSNKNWYECEKAETEGRCADATPMKGKNGELVRLGSTRMKGECPLCPPPSLK